MLPIRRICHDTKAEMSINPRLNMASAQCELSVIEDLKIDTAEPTYAFFLYFEKCLDC
jgi:hypothetical protein